MFFSVESNTTGAMFTGSQEVSATKPPPAPFGFAAPTTAAAGNEKSSLGFGATFKAQSKDVGDSGAAGLMKFGGGGDGLMKFGGGLSGEKKVDDMPVPKTAADSSLADKFKPPPGSWSCKECFIRNEADG